jgi:tRNA(Ile)-lysidine synthase
MLSEEQIQIIRKKCFSEKKGIIELKTGLIKKHPAGKSILFHLLKEFGFNNHQTLQLFNAIQTSDNSGSQFFSETHRIVADRKSLFVVAKDIEREDRMLFDKIPDKILFNNYKIECSVIPVAELNVKASPRFAYLDLDKIELPLLIRYYKEGDYFYPFGMSKPKTPGKVGKKKLSKYFKDEKFSLLEKENTPVLFSGEKAAWLVGQRLDDRFKVSSKTKTVLKMVITDDAN